MENIKIHRLKVFPEKSYELARPYELAPYELAQHPSIYLSRSRKKYNPETGKWDTGTNGPNAGRSNGPVNYKIHNFLKKYYASPFILLLMCNLALFYLKIKKINHAKVLTVVTAGLFVGFLISQGRLWFASNYRKVHCGIKRLTIDTCNNYFVESLNQNMTKPARQTSLNWSAVHLFFDLSVEQYSRGNLHVHVRESLHFSAIHFGKICVPLL